MEFVDSDSVEINPEVKRLIKNGHIHTVKQPKIVLVYKCVDHNYMSNFRTSYLPGSIPSCDDFKPQKFCGNGLHFSLTPKHASYHVSSNINKRFMCCPVYAHEICVIGDYSSAFPYYKIKVPRCAAPIWEVDIQGNPVYRDKLDRINRRMNGPKRQNFLNSVLVKLGLSE